MMKILVLSGLSLAVAATSELLVGYFSAGDLRGWEAEVFSGETEYVLVSLDGHQVLRGDSRGTASGLLRKVAVDLKRTPYLNWSWRVANVLDGVDERNKQGDDYPARVYVMVSGGLRFWKTRALEYVWSSNQPVGSAWANAYTANARMMALRSGAQQVGIWVEEKRDVRVDFKRLFGDDINRIDAVAIMTDTDNSGQVATAWYGDIYFSAR